MRYVNIFMYNTVYIVLSIKKIFYNDYKSCMLGPANAHRKTSGYRRLKGGSLINVSNSIIYHLF